MGPETDRVVAANRGELRAGEVMEEMEKSGVRHVEDV